MKSAEPENSQLESSLVWDLTVRIIHWAVAILFLISWWSAEYAYPKIHTLSGYAVLALVLVRIYWGFFGSTTARFGNFVRGPCAVLSHVSRLFKRGDKTTLGHNPLGALSVVVMLALLFMQPVLGLFAKDIDGLHSGPLSHHVGYSVGRLMADLHHLVFELSLIFVGLHLMAVAFYVVYKRDAIVSAMVSGYKRVPKVTGSKLDFVSTSRAMWALAITAGVLCAIHYFGALS